MRVLGLDPGYATTGYGVVERSGGRLRPVALGVIRTSPGEAQALRLKTLWAELTDLIAQYRPEAVAVERVFFNTNVRTAIGVGQASGVALLAAGQAGVPVTEYTPTEVKLSVVGVGRAAKGQVQAMVASWLGLQAPPESADAADAAALAICHLNRGPREQAVQRSNRRAG